MSCEHCTGLENTDANEPYWLPAELLNDVGQTMVLCLSPDGEPTLRVHAESDDGTYRHESFFGPVSFCPYCGRELKEKVEKQ